MITKRIWTKVDRLKHVFASPDSKGPTQVAREVVALRRRGMSTRHYLERLLYRRSAGDPRNYLTRLEEAALWDAKRRLSGFYRVYHDKTLFDEHYRRPGDDGPFPLPEYFGQTRAGILLRPGRADIDARDQAAFARTIAEMSGQSPTERVFAKPAIANKGTGAILIGPGPRDEEVEALRQETLRADYLYQEATDQHSEMARLNPGCLNTLRIVTGTKRDGTVLILSVALRIGRGTSPIDNTHAGGLVVGVDRETGALLPHARTLYRFGGDSVTRHPETRVSFDGFVVPHYAEAADLARRAQRRLPLLYAGWDVGITPEGPVLIEGNQSPYILMMEVANGGFKADPVVRDFIGDHEIFPLGHH